MSIDNTEHPHEQSDPNEKNRKYFCGVLYSPNNPDHDRLLTQEFIAIGRISAAWATFESLVNQHIAILSGLEFDHAICILAQFYTIQNKSKALISLLRVSGVDESYATTLNKFFTNEVETTLQKRNRIIHDPIFINLSSMKAGRAQLTANRRIDKKAKPPPSDDAEKVLGDIGNLLITFMRFWEDLYCKLPPSVQKRISQVYEHLPQP